MDFDSPGVKVKFGSLMRWEDSPQYDQGNKNKPSPKLPKTIQ